MGVFDSYYAPWGDREWEAQTKHFDSSMSSWSLGSLVPVAEAEDSQAQTSRFWALLEGFSVGNSWRVAGMERCAALAHWDGVFCDVFSGLTEQEAQSSCESARALWEDPHWRSEGLARLHEASRETNRSLSQVANAHWRLGQAWLSWRAQQERERLEPNAPKNVLHAFLASSDHLNFKEKSLEDIWEQLLGSRPARTSSAAAWVCSARAAPIAQPGDEVSLVQALSPLWGAEICQTRRLIPLAPALLPERCEALMVQALREARFDHASAIAQARPGVLSDPATRSETLLWTGRALRSRLFCHDAVKLMIATELYPEVELPDGSRISAADWLLSRTGAGSGAAEALIQARAPMGFDSLGALLLPDYEPLLGQALRSLGQTPDQARDSRGFTLLALAGELSCFAATETLLELGADPAQNHPDGTPVLTAALEACSGASGSSLNDFERVAWALIKKGAPLPERARLTPALAAAYAQREAEALESAAAPGRAPGARRGI